MDGENSRMQISPSTHRTYPVVKVDRTVEQRLHSKCERAVATAARGRSLQLWFSS